MISVFKALQKHQLTTHYNYNYNFVIFAYTRPRYWTELNLLMSWVHFGRKPNRKRVCGSLNRTSQNHYGSEPNRTKPNRDRSKSRLKLLSKTFTWRRKIAAESQNRMITFTKWTQIINIAEKISSERTRSNMLGSLIPLDLVVFLVCCVRKFLWITSRNSLLYGSIASTLSENQVIW